MNENFSLLLIRRYTRIKTPALQKKVYGDKDYLIINLGILDKYEPRR